MNSTGNTDSQNKTFGAGDKKSSAKNKKPRTPLKEHSNPLVRSFAKMSYTVWVVVMAIGMFLAFVIAIFVL